MGLRVTGRNLDIGDVLRNQAEEKINEVVAKYAERGTFSGNVTVAKNGQGFKTDCTLHLAHWGDMHVTGEAADAYASLSVAVERIGKQLRRHKRRRDDHIASGAKTVPADFAANDDTDDEDLDIVETTSAGAAVIAEPVADAKTMSVLGAVAAFEASKSPVLVFRNGGTGRVNVLYRRDDGHFGWVDIG